MQINSRYVFPKVYVQEKLTYKATIHFQPNKQPLKEIVIAALLHLKYAYPCTSSFIRHRFLHWLREIERKNSKKSDIFAQDKEI